MVATDALELGIDIGELDAAICVTFPGTVASLRQMWGRAGRRRRGLAVYVAGEDALDQFFCRHPDEFLERPVEAAILDHRNEQIQLRHLLAAAYEAAARAPTTTRSSATGWRERAERLVDGGRAAPGAAGGYLPRARRLRRRRGSRCARPRPTRSRWSTRDSGEMLGTVEAERAFTTVHPGAIYLHLGRSYEVERARHRARAGRSSQPFDGDWYTQAEEGDRDLHRADATSSARRSASSSTSARSRSPSR